MATRKFKRSRVKNRQNKKSKSRRDKRRKRSTRRKMRGGESEEDESEDAGCLGWKRIVYPERFNKVIHSVEAVNTGLVTND